MHIGVIFWVECLGMNWLLQRSPVPRSSPKISTFAIRDFLAFISCPHSVHACRRDYILSESCYSVLHFIEVLGLPSLSA